MDPEDLPPGLVPDDGDLPPGLVPDSGPPEPRPRDLEGDATGSLNRYVGKTAQNNKRVTDDVMPTLSERTPMTQLADFDVRPEAPPRARDAVEIPQVVRDVANGLIGGFDRLSGASRRQNAMARITGHSPNSGPVEVPDSYSPGALATGGAQALTLGHADELGGAAASLVRGTPYRQEQEAAEARDARIQQEAPGSYAVGTVAGTAPWMLLPGLGEWAGEQAAARGAGGFVQGAARLAGSTAEGAAFGGAAAEGASTADAGSGEWRQDVGEGVAGGALFSGGAQAASELPGLTRAVAQRITGASGLDDAAARLRIRAAGGRSADMTRIAQRPGGVTRFADSLREAGLTGRAATTAEIAERAAPVREQAGARIGEILSEASANAAPANAYRSPPPLHNDVDRLVARIHSEVVAPLERSPLPEARSAARNMTQFLDVVQADRSPLTPERIHEIQRTLDRGINWRAQTVRETSVAGARRDARGVVRDELDRSLEASGARIGDPGLLDEYGQARRAFGAASEVRDWAEREASRGASNRLISPTDYVTGAASLVGAAADGDISAKDAAYAVGGVALNRLVRRREHSIAATGLEALSRALSRPQGAGAPMLSPALRNTLANAARRGSAVYAAAVFSALHTGTPEERAAIQAGLDGTEPEPTQETP